MDEIILYILGLLTVIVLIIIFIIRVIFHFVRKKSGNKGSDMLNSLSRSKEDSTAQFFYLISLLFLGLSLLILNKDFGQIVSWEKIAFVTAAASLFVAYRFKAIFALLLGISLTVFWWVYQSGMWIEQNVKPQGQFTAVLTGSIFIFLIFYAIAQLHNQEPRFKRFALVYKYLGLFPIIGIFFSFSTQSGLSALEDMSHGLSFTSAWQVTITLLILIIGFIAILTYSLIKKTLSLSEASVMIAIGILFLFMAFLPEQSMFNAKRYDMLGTASLSGAGLFWAFLFNILAFAQMIGVIFLGYFKKEENLVNLGAFFMFMFILVKYFDWFFSFMDKSVFFIGAGILLFVVGWFMEKGRRYMISNIKNSTPENIQFTNL